MVEHIKTPGQGHSDMNPIAERYNRKIMDIASAQLYHAKLGVGFWEWSVRHAVYLINRIPLKFHARYHGSKPAHSLVMRVARVSYSRIRTWGCDMYERIPNGPMSSEPGFPNARKLIYLGVSDDGMSFLGYDVEASNVTNELRFCMNVQFDESMTNRTNNLRAYDERRKLQTDDRPQTYDEWDSSVTEGHDHVRALYDTYDTDQQSPTEQLSLAGGPITSAGDGTTSERPSSAGGNGSPDLESKGREKAERVKIPTDLSNASPSTTVEPDSGSEGTDSEDEPYEPSDDDVDYPSDVSEDDYEAPKTRSERSALRRARRSKTDSQMPTSFQRSLSQARVHGPLTEQKLQQARDREELEPAALIRPRRFHKIGVIDSNRPEHLKEDDRTFIKAAFEHNYKIHVSQTFKKRAGSKSEFRFNMVKPATTVSEYIELATASAIGKDRKSIATAVNKAKQDFKYEYDRGIIQFPDRESGHHAHYCDAERIANRYNVERVADLISQNQTNYYANSATQSFNHLMTDIYQVQEAVKWIETKERVEQYGRKAMEAFMLRSRTDLTVQLTEAGLEPNSLDPSTHITPNHYGGVKRSKDREHWEEAMAEELSNCEKMQTWEMIPQALLPPNADLVDCRWVYKIKTTSSGEIARWRARIVARGYSQRPGVDYNEEEVYAPVVSYDTLRTCLSIATATDYIRTTNSAGADQGVSSAGAHDGKGLEIIQADIKNAYLIGSLDSPIYMRQPPSAQMQLDSNGRPMICKLLRPLYGLKQSGHIFANVLHTFLCDELGMDKLVSDKCAFVKEGNPSEWNTETITDPKPNTKLNPNGTQLIILTYVDDLTIMGTKEQTDWVMSKLRNRFSIQEQETGDIEFILSIAIKRDRVKGTLTLNQKQAIEKIAEKMGITVEKPTTQTAMKVTPMVKLSEPETDSEVSNWPYLETVGSLLHISQCTRPDIAYAVGALARHSTTLGKEHINAAKRCVQYLYNTRDLCIMYGGNHQTNEPEVYEAGRSPPSNANIEPQAFADADYAMDVTTRKSTSGGIIFLNGGPISWSSKLQKITAMSTAEAEIIAATESTKEIVHLKLLLAELGARKDGPVQINEDNQACILMGNNMKSSRSAKHYEIRLHYLQESIHSKVIKFKYCPTDEMIADALTKPLDVEKFIYFREKMLSQPIGDI